MYKWLLLSLLSFNLFASPVATLNKLGEGEMSYLFWTLYRAELFSSDAPLETDATANSAGLQKALRITYYRAISRDDLLTAPQDQWLHLGYSQQETSAWLNRLVQIWPSVEPGDMLTLLVSPEQYSEFYLSDRLIGTVQDPRFGEAFLAIWLSEQTSEPKLRQKLLGER
jgi:hypothetical protein